MSKKIFIIFFFVVLSINSFGQDEASRKQVCDQMLSTVDHVFLPPPPQAAVDETVYIDPKLRLFRETLLRAFNPAASIGSLPEVQSQAYIAELRLRSEVLKSEIFKPDADPDKYDYVIVGAGVYGAIYAASLLRAQPSARILIAEKTNDLGGPFSARQPFYLNSTNRPTVRTDDDSLNTLFTPVRLGIDDLNTLPGLPLQLSDVTANRYPLSSDLDRVLIANYYALTKAYPGLDIVFEVEAQVGSLVASSSVTDTVSNLDQLRIRLKNLNPTFSFSRNVKDDYKTLNPLTIFISSGLGTKVVLPKSVDLLVKLKPEYLQPRVGEVYPLIMTAIDFLNRDTVEFNSRPVSRDSSDFVKGPVFVVVGDGDTAKVTIERLFGLSAEYDTRIQATRRPSRVFWVGVDQKTCAAFKTEMRTRYAGAASLFPENEDDTSSVIQPIPGRLVAIGDGDDSFRGERRPSILYVREGSKVTAYRAGNAKSEDNTLNINDINSGNSEFIDLQFPGNDLPSRNVFDSIIFATGLESNLFKFFSNEFGSTGDIPLFPLFPENLKFSSTKDLLSVNGVFERVPASRLTGSDLSNFNTRGPIALAVGSRIIVSGPNLADELPASTTAGVKQNTVAIFNWAKRVAAATRLVTDRKLNIEGPYAERFLNIQRRAPITPISINSAELSTKTIVNLGLLNETSQIRVRRTSRPVANVNTAIKFNFNLLAQVFKEISQELRRNNLKNIDLIIDLLEKNLIIKYDSSKVGLNDQVRKLARLLESTEVAAGHIMSLLIQYQKAGQEMSLILTISEMGEYDFKFSPKAKPETPSL